MNQYEFVDDDSDDIDSDDMVDGNSGWWLCWWWCYNKDDDYDHDGTISISYLSTQCSTCDKRKKRYLPHTSTAINMLHDGLLGGRSIIWYHACKIHNDGDDDRWWMMIGKL